MNFWVLSTQYVNVVRCAHNVEWDFFLWFSNNVLMGNYHFVVRHQSRYSWNWRYGSAAGCSCAGGIDLCDELELGDVRVPMKYPAKAPYAPGLSRYLRPCRSQAEPWSGWSRRGRKCLRRSPKPLASSLIHLMREGWVSLQWPWRLRENAENSANKKGWERREIWNMIDFGV